MNSNYSIVQRFANDPGEPASFPGDPIASALGARLLRIDGETGVLQMSYEPAALFKQGTGVIQGGAVSAMLDFATACAAMAVLAPNEQCATITLTTSFLRPVLPGRYDAYAEIEKRGRSAVFARATLTPSGQPDRLLASATAVLAITPGERDLQ